MLLCFMMEKYYFTQKLFFLSSGPHYKLSGHLINLIWERHSESVTFLSLIVLFWYWISKFTVSKPKQAQNCIYQVFLSIKSLNVKYLGLLILEEVSYSLTYLHGFTINH